MLTRAVAVVTGIVIVAVLISAIIPGPAETETEASIISNRPVIFRLPEYVGAAACQECHQEQFDAWHVSYHRSMTQVVTPETAPDVIRDRTVSVEGETYRFEQEGDRFFVRFNDPTVNWQPRRRQLVMMTGSHHMHVFWYESDFARTPAQLPIIYLRAEKQWIPRRSAFLQPPDKPISFELGRWNQTCSRCHSTNPRQGLNELTSVWDTKVSDFGIACEACHGPGRGHIAFHHKETSSDKGDDLVVNPEDLPHDKKSAVCGQCHSVHIFDFDQLSIKEFSAQGSPFRPGDSLDDSSFIRVVRATNEHWDTDVFKEFATSQHVLNGHFWPDGEVRVTGGDYSAMIESPCYQRGELSCISCHAMHEKDVARRSGWRDDQLKPGMRADTACIQCHAEYAGQGSAHTHHAAGSTGSECMNCHMPYTTYGLLKTIRSHRISSPSVLTTLQTSRPNACNLCHLDKTLEWAADYLSEWYGQVKPELAEEQKEISAAVLQLLKGDAAQRAIQAAAFGWQPAQDVSGTDWMPPFLLIGMNDPYEAVRIIAERSLKSTRRWQDFQYDFLDHVSRRSQLITGQLESFNLSSQSGNQTLLIDDSGRLDIQRTSQLMAERNHRPVELYE